MLLFSGGNSYFARPIKGTGDYLTVMDYIDKNPVKKGLVLCAGDWKESGAYHVQHEITGFVDYSESDQLFFPEFTQQRLLIAEFGARH